MRSSCNQVIDYFHSSFHITLYIVEVFLVINALVSILQYIFMDTKKMPMNAFEWYWVLNIDVYLEMFKYPEKFTCLKIILEHNEESAVNESLRWFKEGSIRPRVEEVLCYIQDRNVFRGKKVSVNTAKRMKKIKYHITTRSK
ncbi:hypothetical protein CWI36_1396p0010 [Hamiltosporidium magnivora]|uniref:Uncharacterized protein n=1 Tax=Hamiltosporidium magnivora TaxID=148818 RepID=A0A4Q9L310_9MICR|nr:hypothetical protein CWI36_1396p0010 [Hamiltosporidium magnivora]